MLLNSAWWNEMTPIHMLAPLMVELFWEVGVALLKEVGPWRLAMMFNKPSLFSFCLVPVGQM